VNPSRHRVNTYSWTLQQTRSYHREMTTNWLLKTAIHVALQEHNRLLFTQETRRQRLTCVLTVRTRGRNTIGVSRNTTDFHELRNTRQARNSWYRRGIFSSVDCFSLRFTWFLGGRVFVSRLQVFAKAKLQERSYKATLHVSGVWLRH